MTLTVPKFGRRTLLAGAALVVTSLAMAGPAFAEAKVLRISTPGAENEIQSKALVVFKDELEKALPGGFDVQIEAMQRGNLEVGMISPQDVAALIPEYSIFTNGYLMRDAKHLDAVYDGDVGAEYKAKVGADLGLEIIRSQYLGSRQLVLVKPREVKTPADLAGLKLRMPGSETWQFLGNALGGADTPLAFEEIYLALQTGTIDGFENPLSDVIANKFYEVTKEVVLTDHMVSNTFFAIAKPYWDGLSDEQKKAIETAEAAAKAFNDDAVLAAEADAVKFLEGQGLTVVTPDVAAFRDQVQKKFLESDFAKTWPAGLLDRINAAGA